MVNFIITLSRKQDFVVQSANFFKGRKDSVHWSPWIVLSESSIQEFPVGVKSDKVD